MVLNFYEATFTFTLVTTRIFAHPATRDFVDGLQKTSFPSPPAIQATWLPAFTMTGLSPARVHCPLLGTPLIKVWPQICPNLSTTWLSNEKNVEIGRYFCKWVYSKGGVKGCRNQDKKRWKFSERDCSVKGVISYWIMGDPVHPSILLWWFQFLTSVLVRRCGVILLLLILVSVLY